jgi:hypothetical protein
MDFYIYILIIMFLSIILKKLSEPVNLLDLMYRRVYGTAKAIDWSNRL